MTDSIMEKAATAGNEMVEETKNKKFKLPHWTRILTLVGVVGLFIGAVEVIHAILWPPEPWYVSFFTMIWPF